MALTKSNQFRHCKRCNTDICKGALYQRQRDKQAVCAKCYRKPKFKSFITWVMEKLE
jgi:hypothetical protein